MSPSISVVLATYNGAQYLQQQLDSLAAQRLLPDELVVADDGSSDETLFIISRFAKHARFEVHLVSDEGHVGWARNFIKGLGHAHGDLVAFCDQDDLWHPNKVLEQSRTMRNDPAIALTTHTWRFLIDRVQRRIQKSYFGRSGRFMRGEADALPPRPIPGMTMMIRRDVAASMCRWWPGWYNDQEPRVAGANVLAHDSFALDVAAALGDLVVIDDPLAVRRLHAKNASTNVNDHTPRLTLSHHHKGVRAWMLRAIRMRERASMYTQLDLSAEESSIEQFFLARAQKYASAGTAYEGRCNIYMNKNFNTRLRALKFMLHYGYEDLGKKHLEIYVTAVRDIAAVVGWR